MRVADHHLRFAAATPVDDLAHGESVSPYEVDDIDAIVRVHVDSKIGLRIEEFIADIAVVRTRLDRLAQDEGPACGLQQTLQRTVKVVEIG